MLRKKVIIQKSKQIDDSIRAVRNLLLENIGYVFDPSNSKREHDYAPFPKI